MRLRVYHLSLWPRHCLAYILFDRRSLHWRAELVGLAPVGVDERAGATLSLHTKYYSAECRIVSLPLPLPAEVEADAAAWFAVNAPDCQAVIAVFDLADVRAVAIEWQVSWRVSLQSTLSFLCTLFDPKSLFQDAAFEAAQRGAIRVCELIEPAVRLCVGNEPKKVAETDVDSWRESRHRTCLLWALDHEFEFVPMPHCDGAAVSSSATPIGGGSVALAHSLLGGGSSISVGGNDGSDFDTVGAHRVREALECHVWTHMTAAAGAGRSLGLDDENSREGRRLGVSSSNATDEDVAPLVSVAVGGDALSFSNGSGRVGQDAESDSRAFDDFPEFESGIGGGGYVAMQTEDDVVSLTAELSASSSTSSSSASSSVASADAAVIEEQSVEELRMLHISQQAVASATSATAAASAGAASAAIASTAIAPPQSSNMPSVSSGSFATSADASAASAAMQSMLEGVCLPAVASLSPNVAPQKRLLLFATFCLV